MTCWAVRRAAHGDGGGGLFLALLAAYSNHFGNGFHFDDAHAVVENPAIRTLDECSALFHGRQNLQPRPGGSNLSPSGHGFARARLLAGQGSESILVPHLDFLLVRDPASAHVPAVPVCARTNVSPVRKISGSRGSPWRFMVCIRPARRRSITSSSEAISTSPSESSRDIVMYAWKPAWRRFGLYLLPPLAAMFSKPPALVFAPLLLVLHFLDRCASAGESAGDRVRSRSVPAFALSRPFLCSKRR